MSKGMVTIDLNFATLIPALARSHQVIGVEMQRHGRTADIDREITPAALAATSSACSISLASTARTVQPARQPGR